MGFLICGIDPGASGGIACITDNGAWAYKMPETPHDLVEHLCSMKNLSGDRSIVCYLEKVHAMPKQGVTSTFKFGEGFGVIQGVLAALKFRLELVTPQKWQTALGCRTGGDKNVSKRKAQELFPDLRITHAIADALLIAEYGRRTEGAW